MATLLALTTICLLGDVALRADSTPGGAEFEALGQRYKQELEQYWQAIGDGKTFDEHSRIVLERWPGNTTVNEFLQLDSKYRGSLVGLSALYQIVSAGGHPSPEAPSSLGLRKALKILTEHYADHTDLDLFFFWLRAGQFAPESKALLRRAKDSPHRHVRATATLALAGICKEESTVPVSLDSNLRLLAENSGMPSEWFKRYTQIRRDFGDVDPASARREALDLLEQVTASYADDLESPRTTYGPILLQIERAPHDSLTLKPRRRLVEIAEAMRFEIKSLAIGQKAVDIAGPDAFGNPLKLSDQYGKVVMLMFSFKGCGPCEAMYPENRKLIEAYRGRPFSFVGVMGDDELATVKEAVEQQKITWPVWWDGGRRGPIATRWNVNAWPETYVLDHQGVIRYRELPSEVLAIAISRLVQEAEQAP